MQQQIVEEMKVKVSIDPVEEIKKRVDFIKSKLLEAHCKSLILGISGGVDSTTCGRLAQLAVNELNLETQSSDYQFIAVRLPYGIQKMKMKHNWHFNLFSRPTLLVSILKKVLMVCILLITSHFKIRTYCQQTVQKLIL